MYTINSVLIDGRWEYVITLLSPSSYISREVEVPEDVKSLFIDCRVLSQRFKFFKASVHKGVLDERLSEVEIEDTGLFDAILKNNLPKEQWEKIIGGNHVIK